MRSPTETEEEHAKRINNFRLAAMNEADRLEKALARATRATEQLLKAIAQTPNGTITRRALAVYDARLLILRGKVAEWRKKQHDKLKPEDFTFMIGPAIADIKDAWPDDEV